MRGQWSPKASNKRVPPPCALSLLPSLNCNLHCTALHCTAPLCSELHCTALHCTALYFELHAGSGYHDRVLLAIDGGAVLGLQHVQGAASPGGHGLPGGAATRELVRDDVAGGARRCRDGLAPGLLERLWGCYKASSAPMRNSKRRCDNAK